MEYTDKIVSCVEAVCGHAEFTITAGEQSFFASKGYPLPKRCKPCRVAKKEQKTAQATAVENRKHSPFGPILDQMQNDPSHPFNRNAGERRGKKPKKGWKHNRRHGREAIGDFEGEM